MHIACLAQLPQALFGFDLPILQRGYRQTLDEPSFDTDHRIDPLSHMRVLLEVARIYQIQAACVGHLAVDHHNLAMEPQVRAEE